MKRKTIYEYHRIDMKDYTISNNTAVVFTAQPTCVSLHSCEKCLSHPNINFTVRKDGKHSVQRGLRLVRMTGSPPFCLEGSEAYDYFELR